MTPRKNSGVSSHSRFALRCEIDASNLVSKYVVVYIGNHLPSPGRRLGNGSCTSVELVGKTDSLLNCLFLQFPSVDTKVMVTSVMDKLAPKVCCAVHCRRTVGSVPECAYLSHQSIVSEPAHLPGCGVGGAQHQEGVSCREQRARRGGSVEAEDGWSQLTGTITISVAS